jgi:hypothetical protein
VLDARYRQNSSNPVTRAHHSAKNAAQLTRYCCYEIMFAGFGWYRRDLCPRLRNRLHITDNEMAISRIENKLL